VGLGTGGYLETLGENVRAESEDGRALALAHQLSDVVACFGWCLGFRGLGVRRRVGGGLRLQVKGLGFRVYFLNLTFKPQPSVMLALKGVGSANSSVQSEATQRLINVSITQL